MRITIHFILSAFLITEIWFGPACSPRSSEPMLCVGYFQSEEEALHQLEEFSATYTDLRSWEKRAGRIRKGIIRGSELNHIPSGYRKIPFNAIVHGRKIMNGYTVENVAFESMPGFFVTGNLYKPEKISGRIPAILCPHGHWSDPANYGRFREDMQRRCAAFARMGAVVFAWDMIGYGESTQCTHNHPKGLQLQLYNGIRVLDYLASLDYVDREKIAITGASGGGTQSFLLTAVDKRITVSVPVVQVSAHFFGGCTCESGMPIHHSKKHETNNVEIAALAAPRPMLLISDGDDWTKNTPEVEYPYILNVYELYGAGKNAENIHFAEEKHDYGFSKRKASYTFLAKHLGLKHENVLNEEGVVTEDFITILSKEELQVFGKTHPRPEHSVQGDQEVTLLLQGRPPD